MYYTSSIPSETFLKCLGRFFFHVLLSLLGSDLVLLVYALLGNSSITLVRNTDQVTEACHIERENFCFFTF